MGTSTHWLWAQTALAVPVLLFGLASCQKKAPETAQPSATAPEAATSAAPATGAVTPEEARAIAKEAYIYGFPMVDNYRIQHAYFVDTKNPEYKGAWNQIINIPR